MKAEFFDYYFLRFLLRLSHGIIWIEFIYGLWTQNPLLIKQWMLCQAIQLLDGLNWLNVIKLMSTFYIYTVLKE